MSWVKCNADFPYPGPLTFWLGPLYHVGPMKLECLQQDLAEGLAIVGRVVPAKSTLPILSNVLLSTRDGELQLTANNLELSVAHRVPAAIAREGEITLPTRLLSDYVALLDHGQKVELDLNPKTHKVHL